jgi:hypothetical protein
VNPPSSLLPKTLVKIDSLTEITLSFDLRLIYDAPDSRRLFFITRFIAAFATSSFTLFRRHDIKKLSGPPSAVMADSAVPYHHTQGISGLNMQYCFMSPILYFIIK